ncbi:serine/threonine-protein kinase [Granulosicoccus antarcticus]|uniref:Serine/threonine-protein kinase PknB n=1 Tax=Granulosicoccus antarcticus IMCC3135 TaxID=1192854 RepID=A0A2Z2NS20_9GAMM|nr:serine/threonine-protein kinase [Granulosicoccus antarcticus]ASJ74272.1 Serine/threonine-protein kinase PknB [Granulosicoccus antarcticus IMCC3135]
MLTETPSIPGYIIDENKLLGEGGFAKVYLAQHISLQINVALKIMDAKLADDDDFCKRFLKEARTCANLDNHPNIIHIYDVGCIGDMYYIAMQYLSGPNLRDILDSGNPYNHPLEILLPIVDALGYAHESGVIHRDVKPANILFNESGRAMLADFGIAKSLNEKTQLTVAGAAIGTAAYMSPEQAKGLAEIDGRSDLYSIGVLLFEMLSGERPYKSTDPMGLMLQHVNDPIPLLPDSESAYQPLISRLMAKEPDDRYQDHHAVLADMNALLAVSPEPENTGTKKLWLGGALIALVIALGAGWSFIDKNGNAVPETALSIGKPELDETLPAEPSPVEPLAVEVPELSEDSPKIQRLLKLAQMHEVSNELTEPPGSNALELYETILREDPDHPLARQRRDEIKKSSGN